MSKHTPGPWAVKPAEVGRPYLRVRGTVLGGRYKVANVLSPADSDRHSILQADIDETHANARLIAAAPDMYRELAHLVRLLEPMEQGGTLNVPGLATLNGARAAIAKAEAK